VTTKKQAVKTVAFKVLCDYSDFMAGRPKKPNGEVKTTYVRIRVTPAERAAIMRRWKAAKAKTESAWIRKRLMLEDA
jgi:hypothetical protein